MPGNFGIIQVISRYFSLRQVRAIQAILGHVRPDYVRLGQFMSGYLDKTGKVRLVEISSG